MSDFKFSNILPLVFFLLAVVCVVYFLTPAEGAM